MQHFVECYDSLLKKINKKTPTLFLVLKIFLFILFVYLTLQLFTGVFLWIQDSSTLERMKNPKHMMAIVLIVLTVPIAAFYSFVFLIKSIFVYVIVKRRKTDVFKSLKYFWIIQHWPFSNSFKPKWKITLDWNNLLTELKNKGLVLHGSSAILDRYPEFYRNVNDIDLIGSASWNNYFVKDEKIKFSINSKSIQQFEYQGLWYEILYPKLGIYLDRKRRLNSKYLIAMKVKQVIRLWIRHKRFTQKMENVVNDLSFLISNTHKNKWKSIKKFFILNMINDAFVEYFKDNKDYDIFNSSNKETINDFLNNHLKEFLEKWQSIKKYKKLYELINNAFNDKEIKIYNEAIVSFLRQKNETYNLLLHASKNDNKSLDSLFFEFLNSKEKQEFIKNNLTNKELFNNVFYKELIKLKAQKDNLLDIRIVILNSILNNVEKMKNII